MVIVQTYHSGVNMFWWTVGKVAYIFDKYCDRKRGKYKYIEQYLKISVLITSPCVMVRVVSSILFGGSQNMLKRFTVSCYKTKTLLTGKFGSYAFIASLDHGIHMDALQDTKPV